MFWTNKAALKGLPKSLRDALEPTFNEHELAVLSRLATLVEVPTGTLLTDQDTPGREALVIVEGEASVLRNDSVIAKVGPGDVVGEMSLLTGEPRTATVVADSLMKVYALTPREFSSLLAQCPRLAKNVTSDALRRANEVAAA